MKRRLWILTGLVCFFVLFALVFGWLSRIVPFVDQRQKAVWEDIYQNKNQIAYAFLGSSHVYCGIDPSVVEEMTGKRAVLVSSGVQSLTETYYNFAELLKYQTPELVFIDLYAAYRDFSVPGPGQDKKPDVNYTNIDCMRLSWNKIRMAREVFPDTFLPYALFPLLREHSNWSNLPNVDQNIRFETEPPIYGKGFSGLDTVVSDEQYQGYLDMAENREPFAVRPADRDALKRIVTLADKRGVEVRFIMIPWLAEFTQKINYPSVVEAVNACLAPEKMVDFQGAPYREMGLSRDTFIADKVSDNQHLNTEGARIFTEYLVRREIKGE